MKTLEILWYFWGRFLVRIIEKSQKVTIYSKIRDEYNDYDIPKPLC
jgi:hypothetical protein